MKTYTITSKQASQIHNAWCYLNNALQQCDELFKEDSYFIKSLRKSLNELAPVRKDIMDRMDADYDNVSKTSQRIAELNGFKNSIWSIYEMDSFDSKSPVPSGAKLQSYYLDKNRHIVVEGSTWLDLWKATDLLIKETADEHGDHVFIEAYRKIDDETYEVVLGS